MGNLASITMCSHFVPPMVEIYRHIQILLPSLGTFLDGDQRERVDSFVCSLDSFMCSLEVQGGSRRFSLGGLKWRIIS